MNGRYHSRSRGSVAGIAFIALVPLVAAIGGFAVDCMHVNDAKGELQRATDAAALAGAQDLANVNGTKNFSNTKISSGNEEPVNFALKVAALNAVDGPIGLWSSSQRTITATILYDSNPQLTQLPGNKPNRCNVQGSIYINSLFAKIFGNFGQNVSTFSAAGMLPETTIGVPTPIKVSWDTNGPNNEKPLSTFAMGSTFSIQLKTNAGWVYNSDPVNQDILMYDANPSANPLTSKDTTTIQASKVYPISIGMSLPDAGVKNDLNSTTGTALQNAQAVIPIVIMDVPFNGNVGGFLGFKVISYTSGKGSNKSILTGTLVPLIVPGYGGGKQVPGVPTASMVRLIQ